MANDSENNFGPKSQSESGDHWWCMDFAFETVKLKNHIKRQSRISFRQYPVGKQVCISGFLSFVRGHGVVNDRTLMCVKR